MALTEPGSYKRILRPNMDHDRWWLGEWPDADRGPIEDPLLRRYLGERRSREIAAWAREQIIDFYGVAAEGQGKADAAVFVEKAPMGRLRLELLGDLLPGTREIALFRDPRDTLCSILAYSARNPRAALVSSEPGTHDDYLEELAASFRGLLAECRKRPEQTLVVRYEDLITDQLPTLSGNPRTTSRSKPPTRSSRRWSTRRRARTGSSGTGPAARRRRSRSAGGSVTWIPGFARDRRRSSVTSSPTSGIGTSPPPPPSFPARPTPERTKRPAPRRRTVGGADRQAARPDPGGRRSALASRLRLRRPP